MSGGHFNYDQYRIGYIADTIEQLILDEASTELDKWGSPKSASYSSETIAEFKRAVAALRVAEVYAQRIDWLASGDDGEDSFHRRLQEDLIKLTGADE